MVKYFVSYTMYMYMYASRLSDHANADLCINESRFSHDISFAHDIRTTYVHVR